MELDPFQVRNKVVVEAVVEVVDSIPAVQLDSERRYKSGRCCKALSDSQRPSYWLPSPGVRKYHHPLLDVRREIGIPPDCHPVTRI